MDKLLSCDSGDKVADILEDSIPVIFAALGALLEAAKGVSAVYIALENILSQFQATLDRVDEYVNGHTDVARLLMERQAAVDSCQSNEWTPLHFAAESSHADIVRLLLEHLAAVDARRNDEWTPLHVAAQNGHADFARLLFEHQAAVDAQEIGEWARLYVAALKDRADVAPCSWNLEQISMLAQMKTKHRYTRQQSLAMFLLSVISSITVQPSTFAQRTGTLHCLLQWRNIMPACPLYQISHLLKLECSWGVGDSWVGSV